MIWSKKQRLFREMLAPMLRKRLAIHTTGYRDSYEQRGRTWIEFDGKEILSYCDFTHENAWRNTGEISLLADAGIYSKQDFGRSFGDYLGISIESALASDDPIVVGLAVLDRRVGKRKLHLLKSTMTKEPAQTLLKIRLVAEGITENERVV